MLPLYRNLVACLDVHWKEQENGCNVLLNSQYIFVKYPTITHQNKDGRTPPRDRPVLQTAPKDLLLPCALLLTAKRIVVFVDTGSITRRHL